MSEHDPISDRALSPFHGADSCLVSDALDRDGLAGAAAGLRRFSAAGPVTGRAVTIQLESALTGRCGSPSHLGAAAIDAANPGDVIVVANRGDVAAAAWGGLLGRAAARRGIIAAVIDGAVRDVDELDELGFPVFAAGASPRSARGRFVETATQVPVQITGFRVSPGDWVIADGSGVAFVPAERADQIQQTVAELQQAEANFKTRIDGNESPEEVLDTRYEKLSRPGARGG